MDVRPIGPSGLTAYDAISGDELGKISVAADDPDTTTRIITVKVNDGIVDSAPLATVNVTLGWCAPVCG